VGTLLASLSSSGKTIEIAVIAVVLALLAVTLVLYTRKGVKGRGKVRTEPSAASYYQDLGALPATGSGGPMLAATGPSANPSDPFAGFGSYAGQPAPAPTQAPPPLPPLPPMTQPAMGQPGMPQHAMGQPTMSQPAMNPEVSQPVQAAAPPPYAPMAPAPGTPAPATPAGWLPDPSGAPDTLRYWDGSAWTQHVAQRT
jgi:hypothetical protein